MPKTLIVDACAGFERLALLRAPGDLEVHQAQEIEPRVDAGEVDLHPFLIDDPPAVGERGLLRPARCTSSKRPSIMPELHSVTRSWLSWLVISFQPPLSLPTRFADRDAHVVVEGLVGVHVAHVLDRHDAHARRLARHDEHRDALVLRRRRDRCAPRARCSRRRSARLVKIFCPLMTKTSPSRTARVLQRGQVGAGARARCSRWRSGSRPCRIFGRKNFFCSSVPNCMIVGATEFTRQHRHRRAGAHRLVEEDELLDRRHAAAAVLLRPADAEPAVGAHLADDLADDRPDALRCAPISSRELGREQLLVVGAQLLAQRLVLADCRRASLVWSPIARDFGANAAPRHGLGKQSPDASARGVAGEARRRRLRDQAPSREMELCHARRLVRHGHRFHAEPRARGDPSPGPRLHRERRQARRGEDRRSG